MTYREEVVAAIEAAQRRVQRRPTRDRVEVLRSLLADLRTYDCATTQSQAEALQIEVAELRQRIQQLENLINVRRLGSTEQSVRRIA